MNSDRCMKTITEVNDAGDGSPEDRSGLRFEVVLAIECDVTGFMGRQLLARCATKDAADALEKWCRGVLEQTNG